MNPSGRRFRLLPFFSVASLISIVIVSVIMSVFFRDMAIRNVTQNTESENTLLTRVIAGTIWPDYSDFLTSVSGQSPREIREHPEYQRLYDEVRRRMQGLPILKIKIYDVNGFTVFSTDESQLGQDKSSYAGFHAARTGEVVSALTFRDQINSFENTIADRHIVTSYFPVRSTPDGEVEGVFELYADVTPQIERLNETQLSVFSGVIGTLLLLYVVLLLFVQHADRIIRRQEEAFHLRAHYDELTGLPNRALFRDRLQQAIHRSLRQERLVAIMFIDMDRFKTINDTLGHEAGDALLREISHRLKGCLRPYDTAARLGGDEFTVILEGIRDVEEIDNVAERIVYRLGRPYRLFDKEQHTNASIGITVYPFDDESIDNLLKNADIAMYRAKEAGGNQFVYYSDSMQKQLLRRHEIENGLHRALANRELRVYYQPKIDLESGLTAGVEALVRWDHPEQGLVSPAEFIPVAEESQLIVRIGEYVIEQTGRDLRRWLDSGLTPPRISVNISARQFLEKNFVEKMTGLLAQSGVSPDGFELEITESILVEQHDLTAMVLARLRKLGVTVSLDDFGTGYSSLRYLRELPVDVVKIDRSFIAKLDSVHEDRELVQGMIALAKSLHLEVVAEGVETSEQASLLRTMRCDLAQGYLYARPMPENAIAAWLRDA